MHDIRTHIANLLALLKFCNSMESGQWASRVYGDVQRGLRSILEEQHGQANADAILDRFHSICGDFSIQELDGAIDMVNGDARDAEELEQSCQ